MKLESPSTIVAGARHAGGVFGALPELSLKLRFEVRLDRGPLYV